jgi:uncharacterized phage infection (PIP) family protein YhgE
MTTNINLSGTGSGNCGIDNAVSRVSSSITEVAQKAYKVANGTIRTAVIARDGMDKANQAIVGLRKIACVMSDLESMIEQLSLHAGKLREMPDAFEQFTQEVIWVTDKYTREDINSNNLNAMREELASIAAGTAGKISEVSQQITHLTDVVNMHNAIDAGIRQVEEGAPAAYNSFAVLDRYLTRWRKIPSRSIKSLQQQKRSANPEAK